LDLTPARLTECVSYERRVSIEFVKATLEGSLGLPPHPCGIVLFAHGAGAAAALVFAAHLSGKIAAVVSRGGRPDLAGNAVDSVLAPTLLIVGGHDGSVIDLNEPAVAALGCSGVVFSPLHIKELCSE
jgi:hypothetical protein